MPARPFALALSWLIAFVATGIPDAYFIVPCTAFFVKVRNSKSLYEITGKGTLPLKKFTGRKRVDIPL